MKNITPAQLKKACEYDSQKLGKWFESKIEEYFKEAQEHYPVRCIRLYDTHSAGSYLPPTDGDYIVMSNGKGFLVEAKCSAKHGSLRSCLSTNVSKVQALSHRLWHRAGGYPVFIFASVSENKIQFWNGNSVGLCRAKGYRLDEEMCRAVGHLKEGKLTDMQILMENFFL